MVTERVQGRAPWLLQGAGKGDMVNKRVRGRAPWLLSTGKSAMVITVKNLKVWERRGFTMI